MKIILACLALSAACLASSTAQAVAPALIPLQGYLTDRSDKPLQGEFDMHFALYGQASGGTALFEETQRVQVQQGHFSAYLGDDAELPLVLFREHAELFVSVTISDDAEIKPRMRLATAPYAAYSAACGDASSLGGLPANQLARSNHSHSASDLQSGTLDPERFDAYADLMKDDRLKADDPDDLLTLATADARYMAKTSRGKSGGFSDPFGTMPDSTELAASSFIKVASQQIDAPGPGYILGIASASVLSRNMAGSSSFWLTLTGPTQQVSSHTSIPAAAVNAASVHGVFPVTSSGPHTFNLTALIAAAEGGVCRSALISLVFVPAVPP
ncbi:MAG TPA: hypothetical protein VJV78_11875 [Polyangiales bacterium]|nr:hypothetical protein [Polyangiales bacterium]